MSAVLQTTGLSRVFGSGDRAVTALDDVDLSIDAGELVVLRGPSGSGKTTLLTLLGGLDVPTAGRVVIDGTDLGTLSEPAAADLRARSIGYVFQSFGLIPVLSAAENIEIPLRILRTPAAEREARVAELLDRVGLSSHSEQRPYELSGGQQQRVGIARALANRPRILLADEPTGQLDSGTGASMMDLIVSVVRSEGVAALVSTHDPAVAALADRVLELHDGRLSRRGRHAAQV
ncbi:ABC transporter ATP-binding protein [Microcella humidisoli]|uniref:ABC transporter ATP-binding protein n=1 Tax=Microcella humidisoli TaxID=2963406 RepID=A0ABY5FTH9_9MICO|nr:ABC transporter ATP-binding protein [Microcella humidisoli]UTT61599.1 ABC transporter ATP-binding protein [Microcella humidisoli]